MTAQLRTSNLHPWLDAGARFDGTGRYRYSLWRAWEPAPGPLCTWVMLNPSTADATQEDPTIRRCIGFARRWGFGAIAIVNLFALRSTDPRALYADPAPVGELNDDAILEGAELAAMVVCAWGAHGQHLGRADHFRRLLRPYQPRCLGVTKHGHPRHPLYLRGDLTPEALP